MTTKAKAKPKKAAAKKSKASTGRLRPGALDGLVLTYMEKNEGDLPLTASAIAKGIGRSSGAVANCLARLTKQKKARQAKRKPRAYALPKREGARG
ncbi:MAG TPA: hypothetical protein VG898_10215 [Solirubrobacterales bacterium]|nr:hypothetical protein [Solirubrobacterales bacterium]